MCKHMPHLRTSWHATHVNAHTKVRQERSMQHSRAKQEFIRNGSCMIPEQPRFCFILVPLGEACRQLQSSNSALNPNEWHCSPIR